jgi:hypothetical protein
VKTKEEIKLRKRRRQLCKQTTERRKQMKTAGASKQCRESTLIFRCIWEKILSEITGLPDSNSLRKWTHPVDLAGLRNETENEGQHY